MPNCSIPVVFWIYELVNALKAFLHGINRIHSTVHMHFLHEVRRPSDNNALE